MADDDADDEEDEEDEDDEDDEDDELEADAVLLAVLLLDEESEDFVSLVLLSAGSDELDLLPARASLR